MQPQLLVKTLAQHLVAPARAPCRAHNLAGYRAKKHAPPLLCSATELSERSSLTTFAHVDACNTTPMASLQAPSTTLALVSMQPLARACPAGRVHSRQQLRSSVTGAAARLHSQSAQMAAPVLCSHNQSYRVQNKSHIPQIQATHNPLSRVDCPRPK